MLVEQVEEYSLAGVTNRETILRLLTVTGFVVRREWDSYDWKPYKPGDSLLIVEAVKRK